MKQQIKSILQGWGAHLGIVIIITILDYYLLHYLRSPNFADTTPWQYFIRHALERADCLVLAIWLLLIEVNYHYLYKKLPIWLFIPCCFAVGIISCSIGYISAVISGNIKLEPVLIIAAYALGYAVIRGLIYNFRYRTDLKLAKVKNELDALKAQLNPHFLFNSLNYLYGTALTEKALQTADGIDKLSELMRYTITGIHENFIPLESELNFIERYLALQQARLPKKEGIKIEIHLPSTYLKTLQIAPLILLPFIENAFKYGINMDEPCFVNLSIEITGTDLTLTVSNSIISRSIEIEGNNTGIKNTIKRLKLLYPGKHTLQQTNTGTAYNTLLTLKLKS